MPEQITSELPSLYGGISTQPKHLRLKTQVKSATNVVFSVKHGLAKRNGTRFFGYVAPTRIQITGKSGAFAAGYIASTATGTGTVVSVSANTGNWVNIENVTGTFSNGQSISFTLGAVTETATISQVQSQYTTGDQLRLFPVYRDSNERYLIVVGPGAVPRIFPVSGGQEAEVTCSSAALTYFGLNSATGDDFRMFSIADATLVCNSTVVITGNNTAGTIDATKMPHTITRTSLSPLAFSIAVTSWASRASGTSTTNPLPKIWLDGTNRIADLCVSRDRLMIGAGTRVQTSRTSNYFDFWISNASNLVDSDPVEVSLPGQQIAFVDRLTPYRDSVVILSKAARQFELSSPDVFSPSTAAITASTSYETVSCNPASMGSGLVFAGRELQNCILYSYEYNDLQVASVATPLSLHIDGTLPNDLSKIVASPNSGFAACIAPSTPTTIYVYFEHWNNNQRFQTAWGKWTFPQFSKILSIAVIEGVLYVLGETTTSGQFVIEGVVIGTSLSSTTETIAPTGGGTSVSDEGTPLPTE